MFLKEIIFKKVIYEKNKTNIVYNIFCNADKLLWVSKSHERVKAKQKKQTNSW